LADFDSVMNFLVPAVLLLIAAGFIYIKFISPWVVPMLSRLWEWVKGSGSSERSIRKEISFE
jgi:hypothetical protein